MPPGASPDAMPSWMESGTAEPCQQWENQLQTESRLISLYRCFPE